MEQLRTGAATAQRDRLIGRIIAGRYRLETTVGEGGIGSVFRARHLLIDRVVAVKILRPSRRGERYHRDWFLREARAANRVRHENIVDIHDFGDTEDGLFYLVMEYFEGRPLSRVINQGPMELGRATHIMRQCCSALAVAHDHGVVHRDIKSDNVFLIHRRGDDDFVKVIDFGLASLTADGKLEPDGAVFGTMEYMSPEQTRGEDATPASDRYGLGVLFFEMLTGQLPFIARERDRLLELHQRAVPPRASDIRPGLPSQVDRIIGRLLDKDPAERYSNTHDLYEELVTLERRAQREASGTHARVKTERLRSKPTKPTVLILDDSKVMLCLYGALLRGAGLEVQTAGSISELETVLEGVEPSIILVDVLMPELEGDEVVPLLRKKYPMLREVPIILVSSMPEAEAAPRVERAGANGFIPKNLPVENFVDRVRRYLRPCDRPNIFILDDDRVSLRLYETLLKTADLEVHAAADLPTFDRMVRTQKPSVILVDVLMPELDGDSVARILRERYPLDDVPIVLLSSLSAQELALRSEAAGADGFIEKAGSMDTFVDRVRGFLVNEVRSERRTETDMLLAG